MKHIFSLGLTTTGINGCLLLVLLFANIRLLYGQAGNAGINTSSTQAHLDIHGSNTRILLTDDVSTASSPRYTNRLEISPPDIFQASIGFAIPHFLINSSGYIGMGTGSPAYPPQTPSNINNWGLMDTNGSRVIPMLEEKLNKSTVNKNILGQE